MKHLYLFGILLIAYLLFTGCSPKETFYFSRNTGSYGPYHKVQKEVSSPDKLVIPNKLTDLERTNTKDSPELTATAATAANAELLPLPKQTQAGGINTSIPARKVETLLSLPVVKNKALQNQAIKKYLNDPLANKKVQGAALASFVLTLPALITFFTGTWPFTIIAGIFGSILGLIGLIKIKRNPDKYAGKGLAWIGMIIGLILALFIIGFLMSFGSQ